MNTIPLPWFSVAVLLCLSCGFIVMIVRYWIDAKRITESKKWKEMFEQMPKGAKRNLKNSMCKN